MSRPRRRVAKQKNPNDSANNGGRGRGRGRSPSKGQAQGQGQSQGQGQDPAAQFWHDGGDAPRTVERIRPTTDPAALPRSLGEPPLTPDTAAEHHLAVVYEEAVRTAAALAAVNGLLQEDESG